MLTRMDVINSFGALLSLELGDISDGIVLRDVEGLDPVKATIVSSSFAQMDGAQYHSSRREARNIIIHVELEPDYILEQVADVRRRLYNFFMPKKPVRLNFVDSSSLVVDISGRVESCEAPLFTDKPAMDISVICFDPDFVELTPVDIEGDTVDDETEFVIDYTGTAETGIEFVLNLDRALTEFTIYHKPPDDVVRTLDFAAELLTGDVLRISTVVGAKEATVNRGGTLSSVLYGVSTQSNWIQLETGENALRVYAEGAPIPFEISYIIRHGGL